MNQEGTYYEEAYYGNVGVGAVHMLLYFTTDAYKPDGTLNPIIGIMKKLPTWRVKLGGLLGPVAAFFYCIGYYHITLSAVDEYRTLAFITTLISCMGIIVGGAYHSQFTYLGLIGKIGNETAMNELKGNIKLLNTVSFLFMGLGALGLALLIVFGKTYYPPWAVVFSPAVLFLLVIPLGELPQPYLSVLFGGWYNLMYAIYFGASLFLIP